MTGARALGDAVHAERKLVAVDGEALEHIFRRFIIKGRDGRGMLEVVRVERGLEDFLGELDGADSSRIWDTLQKCFGQAAVVKAPSVLLSARQKVASTSSSSAWRPLLGDDDVMLPSPKRLRSEARRWGISGVQRPPLAQGSGSAIFNSAAAASRYAYSPTPCMCFPAHGAHQTGAPCRAG